MTFFLLAAGVDNKVVDHVAGYFGLFTALVAFWLAGAELINDILGGGTELIPLGKFRANLYRSSGNFHVPGRIYTLPSNPNILAQNNDVPNRGEECQTTISERFKMFYSEREVEDIGINRDELSKGERKSHFVNDDRDEEYIGEKRVTIEDG